MKYAKDYIEARVKAIQQNHNQQLSSLESLLEKAIEHGQASFITNGYIPLSLKEISQLRYCSYEQPQLYEKLRQWLSSYRWDIITIDAENIWIVPNTKLLK